MKKFKSFIRLISEIGIFKTLYFNFKYFGFKRGLSLPIFVSRHTRLRCANGQVLVYKGIKLGGVRLGFDNVGVFDNKKSRSIWEVSNGTVEFKGRAKFGNGFKICVHDNGKLVFGNGFVLTAESTIICYKEIVFGNDCLLSWDILVMDTDFHNISNSSDSVINVPKSILIGDKVWIGCRTLILKGSEVRSGSVIGAASVVSGVLKSENSVYAGSPPKLLKTDIRWNP